MTEATSRSDYVPLLDDASSSLGEIGRCVRSEKRLKTQEPAPEAGDKRAPRGPPMSQSAIAAISRISKQADELETEQKSLVADALLAEAADDAKAGGSDAEAAAMGVLDLAPVAVGAAAAAPADDSTDLDDA